MEPSATKLGLIEEEMERLNVINKNMKELNIEKKLVEANLQSYLLPELENKNLKFIEIETPAGSVNLTYKQKFEIDDVGLLMEVVGTMLESKIETKVKTEVKITDKNLEKALVALYFEEYKKSDIDALLFNMGLDDKQIRLATKKLKGDYKKDKELLESFGLDGDVLEEELDEIKDHKDWELVQRYFGDDEIDHKRLLQAIFVDETLAFGTKFSKETDDGGI